MIIKIAPIKRLPAELDELDYLAPKNLEKEIKPGQLVTIPFRKSEIFGLILAIDKKQEVKNPKEIKSIVQEVPILNKKQIDFLKTASQIHKTPLGAILKMSLLPLKKNKLKKIELLASNPPVQATNINKKPNYYHCQNIAEHEKYLLSAIKKQTLILVPEIHLIDEVRNLLPIEKQKQTAVWHSELTDKQKFDRWLQIRNGQKKIIIGTRGAVFLPFFDLKSIVVDYEHEENHKHWDQAPRFHDKDLVRLLAGTNRMELNYMSYSPSSTSYFHIHKNNYKQVGQKQLNTNYKNLQIINISKERQAGNFDIFSFITEEEIEKTKGDIFLMVNKLGFAGSLNCEKCGYSANCERCSLPLVYSENNLLTCNYCKTKKQISFTCPKCQGNLTKLKGRAIEYVEKKVAEIIKNTKNHKIIRIDSTVKDKRLYTKKNKIIIGTKMALRYINWNKTDLIAILDTDRLLQVPEYLAAEKVWHLINEINYYKKSHAKFLIQTNNPENIVFRSLKEPDRFYRTDLNSRQKLGYPPYSYLVKYFYGHPNQKTAENQAVKIYDIISKELTKIQKSAKISGPIEMYPSYYRKKYWFSIYIKLDPKNWILPLTKLNKRIPAGWKVDPNPISLLHP